MQEQQGEELIEASSGRFDKIHAASLMGDADCVKKLILAGVDPNETDHDEMTPLHTAAALNHVDCIKVLLEMGADHSPQNNAGLTPLHLAMDCDADFYGSVEALLVGGADAAVPDKDGCVPILNAVLYTQLRSARLLLQARANPFAKVFDPTTETTITLMDLAHAQLKYFNNLDGPFKDCPQISKAQEMIELLQEYQARWCMREFCAVSLLRLGAESPAQVLPQDVYVAIFEQLLRLK